MLITQLPFREDVKRDSQSKVCKTTATGREKLIRAVRACKHPSAAPGETDTSNRDLQQLPYLCISNGRAGTAKDYRTSHVLGGARRYVLHSRSPAMRKDVR